MRRIKQFLKNHSGILCILSVVYRIAYLNRKQVKGSNNHIKWKNCFVKQTKVRILGNANTIEIGVLSKLQNCRIYIGGDNNYVKINKECVMDHLEIWIEDDGNFIEIGPNTWVTGKTHIAVTEGTTVKVGERCLFSEEIVIRTGDSHSILDKNGKRINRAQNVEIGNHAWIGNRAMLLKGAEVGNDSVVGRLI